MKGPIPPLFCVIPVVVVGGGLAAAADRNALLAVSPIVMGVLVIVGGTNRLVGAPEIALAQIDIKRGHPPFW